MNPNQILIRYGEIYLKGRNRGAFERQLLENIRLALSGFPCELTTISGRYIVRNYEENSERPIVERLQKVFGVSSVSVAVAVASDLESIESAAAGLCGACGSFKVETKRADKRYPIHSTEVSARVGSYLLERYPKLKVDLFRPDFTVRIEIREDGKAYVFAESFPGCGGLPVGCSGKGLLLLSGGIDSPVAGYLMARRGMSISGLHFHSYPYTSELAKEKVIALAKILKEYTLRFRLNVVPFTEIQNAIHENCPEQMMVILMRRFMMRIANRVCRRQKLHAIVTGENLAQVASQTIQSLTVTNMLAEVPVLRPVVGFDKIDIISVANKIGTYETSILPYEDCCTVFLPEHPVIKPRIEQVLAAEQALPVDELVENALAGMESIMI